MRDKYQLALAIAAEFELFAVDVTRSQCENIAGNMAMQEIEWDELSITAACVGYMTAKRMF